MDRIENPEIDSHKYAQLIFDESADVAQSYPTLWNPMNYTVHRIL